MSQADQQVQNAEFPAVRTDINDNLAALFSQSSGASAPAVTVAFQPWIDTNSSPAIWKIRNAANSGWITVGTISATTFSTSGLVAIANGGTGETTATAALAALLPSQAGNSGKALTTDGSLAAWGTVAASQIYQFNASGTWTKPATGTMALVYLWGGGGSGSGISNSSYAGGGGGGAFNTSLYSLADLPSTVTITVGAGGTAVANSNGINGGATSFGSLLYAYGGAGGTSLGGRGGSDIGTGAAGTSSLEDGGAGGASNGAAGSRATWGGGGGGAGVSSSIAGGSGGWSSYGGAGGGGASSLSPGLGGTSKRGGGGGNGAYNQNNPQAGSIPGGGGGGTGGFSGTSFLSGAGGAGRCIIYVW